MHTYRTFTYDSQRIRILTIGPDQWVQSRDLCDALGWTSAPSHLLYSVAKPDRLVLKPGAVLQRQPVAPGLVPSGVGSITLVHVRALPVLLGELKTEVAQTLLAWLEGVVFPAYGLRTPQGLEASTDAVRLQLIGLVRAHSQELREVEERIDQTAADLEALRTLRAMLETKQRQMMAALSELTTEDDQEAPEPEQVEPEAVEAAPWD
jgi:hypothetical protein